MAVVQRGEVVAGAGRGTAPGARPGPRPGAGRADIDDTVTALVWFRGGATTTYTLVGRSAREGYEVRLDGTGGGLAARDEAVRPPRRAPAAVHRIDVWPDRTRTA